MANKFKIPQLDNAVKHAVKDALSIIARDSVVHFQKSFANEGFIDENLQRWEKRKNYSRRGKANGGVRSVKKYRKILTFTGKLRRSIKITSFSMNTQTIESNMPYSAIHNEGLQGRAWGKYSFKMPKRKFMGNSKKLERLSQAKFIAKINTAIKNL
ncbi:Phage virion morphogensis protein [uncultured Caudovirales phage]|uniref:Phage virion morphogensis protein n=1 Tax=uncultured Caudovirales phage TaxID=2100421 RepID=A0A6J5L4C9_9CAUD|nr:Phage virion morphogensis protein [uncultured Caudovirales phage]